jgi:hypothetical protein
LWFFFEVILPVIDSYIEINQRKEWSLIKTKGAAGPPPNFEN